MSKWITTGERPTYVNSIAVGPKGNVYTLARFEHNGRIIEDLVKIPNPFLKNRWVNTITFNYKFSLIT